MEALVGRKHEPEDGEKRGLGGPEERTDKHGMEDRTGQASSPSRVVYAHK